MQAGRGQLRRTGQWTVRGVRARLAPDTGREKAVGKRNGVGADARRSALREAMHSGKAQMIEQKEKKKVKSSGKGKESRWSEI